MRPDPIRSKPADLASLEAYLLEDSTVVATLLVSACGEIVGGNRRMRAFLAAVAPQPPMNQPFANYINEPAAKAAWLQTLAAAGNAVVVIPLRATDGSDVVLRGDFRPVPGLKPPVFQTILVESADEQLKAVVRQSARMEALGSLTAGIAHDFNNLLTVLVGNLYLAAEEVRGQPKLFAKLKSARDAAKRGGDLIKQLLTFARREQAQTEMIDPAQVVQGVLPLLERALGNRIRLDARIDSNAGPVKASTAQLESVVVNLAINARDAIEKKGAVTIQVKAADVAGPEAARRGLARAGTYVAVEVQDDGGGISPAVLGRIFEPFFSTKNDRGGTGLGLSMVRWFAETCGGCVFADSSVGAGTTVTVLLPRANGEVVEANDKTMPLSTLPTGTETVLVLAAEEGLRTTIRQILEVLGYTVTFAADSKELLAAAQRGIVQLVIADAAQRGEYPGDVLGQVSGPLQIPVIVATDTPAAEPQRDARTTVLAMPFSIADLATAVRRTLDVRDRSA